ncbi:MAG: hypothetical protein HC896_05685 [Bacteroidales bacterium]|nr:hypothetical protein [Bacteroidales bacterium]
MRPYHLLLLCTISLFAFAILKPEPTTIRKTLPLNKAKEIRTFINFPAGEINIRPSTKQLLESKYVFFEEEDRPVINYEEIKGVGHLRIEAPNTENTSAGNDSCTWDIALGKSLCNSVYIKALACQGNINLEGCALKRFEFEMLAGEANINLRNTSVPVFVFRAFAGETNIILSGKWNNDLNAIIKGGMGEMNIVLPNQLGIKMNITGLLGEKNVPDFKKEGTNYTNHLYGKTDCTLYLDITGGIGEINVLLQ